MSKKVLVALTGAGISAESGIKTFRDSDGLWENHRIEDVATPQGWHKNKALVLEFYNQRRTQLIHSKPNAAHHALAELEKEYEVLVITQNVDDLHERAGSTNVIHLHGELMKVRSSVYEESIYPWGKDLKVGDLCERGTQLRPHIVWFGEAVPMIEKAIALVQRADIFVVIGTSLQVYPAAGLIDFTRSNAMKYYIDPNANAVYLKGVKSIAEKATSGMQQLIRELSS